MRKKNQKPKKARKIKNKNYQKLTQEENLNKPQNIKQYQKHVKNTINAKIIPKM